MERADGGAPLVLDLPHCVSEEEGGRREGTGGGVAERCSWSRGLVLLAVRSAEEEKQERGGARSGREKGVYVEVRSGEAET